MTDMCKADKGGVDKDSLGEIAALKSELQNERPAASTSVAKCLDRIELLDKKLHAFVLVDETGARDRARLIDEAARQGKYSELAGAPIAIKDLFHWAGHPTRAGSLELPAVMAQTSAIAVSRLENAGANVIGKTHTVEFAFGGWGTNLSVGTPWNPHDMECQRVPGGSSSGSAVAVASGMAMAALGTDTGGSIRTPASYCGVVGVKTSLGLISRTGVFPLCPTLDSVGVLTRTVVDAAVLLDVMAGQDPADPTTLGAPHLDFGAQLGVPVEGLRLGRIADDELDASNAEVQKAYFAALRQLESLGAHVTEFHPPEPLTSYLLKAGRLMSFESYRSLSRFVEREDSRVDATIRDRILAGRDISKLDYDGILGERESAKRLFAERFSAFDAIVTPTCVETAIPVVDVDQERVVTPYGRFVNFLDLAAVSVPACIGQNNLPIGIQIVVQRFADPLALRIATEIQRWSPLPLGA